MLDKKQRKRLNQVGRIRDAQKTLNDVFVRLDELRTNLDHVYSFKNQELDEEWQRCLSEFSDAITIIECVSESLEEQYDAEYPNPAKTKETAQ